jgi:divalent metal cation (Fe/Co/Zn/Cd) transporter
MVQESLNVTARSQRVLQGVRIELITIAWMTVEAAVALYIGSKAHSVSLEGFGLDSLIELLAGGVLLWRLLIEQRGSSLARVEFAERRAAWITACSLFALAAYILIASGLSLAFQTHADPSLWGVGLALSAAIVMPILWQTKFRIARAINSAALKADAACSITCAYMSLTLLAGLLLNRLFGWWWADPLAALALVYFLVQEAREALHEARTGETCSCGHDDCCDD